MAIQYLAGQRLMGPWKMISEFTAIFLVPEIDRKQDDSHMNRFSTKQSAHSKSSFVMQIKPLQLRIQPHTPSIKFHAITEKLRVHNSCQCGLNLQKANLTQIHISGSYRGKFWEIPPPQKASFPPSKILATIITLKPCSSIHL